MARGTQFRVLVEMLKAEIGASTLVSVGVDALPEHKQAIVRTQALLYDEYDWPFLQIRPFKDLEAGEKYYDFPTEIGRVSCRERVCQYVYISVVADSLKKKTNQII